MKYPWKKEFLDYILHFLYSIGYFGEIIMIIVVFYVLYKTPITLIVYTLFLIINGIINRLLKKEIHEKRPNQPISFLYSNKIKKENNNYGMPSGHSENVFYSTLFLYLNVKKIDTSIVLSLFICAMTIYQRWYFHNHTLSQLLVGAIIGCIFAYIVYSLYMYLLYLNQTYFKFDLFDSNDT